MANMFSVDVPDVGNALQALMQGYQFTSGIGREHARRQALGESGGNVENALARLIQMGDIEGAAKIGSILQAQQGMQGVYGTPIYGTGPNGETQIGTFDKRGQFKQVQTPGFTPTPGVKMMDTGTGYVPVQSKTGQPVPGGTYQPGQPQQPGQRPQTGFIPKENQEEARQKKVGGEIAEKQAKMGSAKSALDTAMSNIDRMSDTVNTIANDPALGKITGLQGVFQNFPGGRAANVQARLDNLVSQVGINVLQAMRDASKTGGAVGQVTEREWPILQNNLVALSRAQDEKQFRTELNNLVKWGEGVKQRLKQAYDADYGSLSKQGGSTAPQSQQGAPQSQTWTDPATNTTYVVRDGKLYPQ